MSRPDAKRSSPLYRLLTALVVAAGLVKSLRSPARRPAGVDPEAVAAGYEQSDWRVEILVASTVVFLVVLGVVLLLVTTLEAGLTGVQPTISRPADLINGLTPGPTPAAPRLEAQSGQDLSAYRADQQQKLTTYHWVDRPSGVVAIPIDRAMDRIADEGLPARPAPTAQAARDRGAGSPSAASSGRVEEPMNP